MIGTHSAPGAGGNSVGDSATQIVLGIAVVTGKVRAGEPKNFLDLRASPSLRQQVSGHPQIHDAPVGLRKALRMRQRSIQPR